MTENARLQIRLSATLRKRAESAAASRELTASAWVKQLILDAVNVLPSQVAPVAPSAVPPAVRQSTHPPRT